MKNKLLFPLVAGVALITGAWISSLQFFDSSTGNISETRIQGMVLEPARKIGIPALTKDDGSTFSSGDLTKHWSLMFFGYTSCPDICPTTLTALAAAKAQDTDFPRVFFVSIDPQRDKVKMLSEYVKYFDKDFIGVTGEEKMIAALTLQTSVVYMKVPGETGNENEYLMDHSTALLLINPEGQLRAFLKPPHTPQAILESIKSVKGN